MRVSVSADYGGIRVATLRCCRKGTQGTLSVDLAVRADSLYLIRVEWNQEP